MLYQPNPTPQPVQSRYSFNKFVADWLKPALQMVLFYILIDALFPRYYADGLSMEPGIHTNDRFIAANIDLFPVQRGDVVTLLSPISGERLVKRVIGLPGEVVELRDGLVYIDGVPLSEDYVAEPIRDTGRWELADDEYFILGDNRNHSYDSSEYGPVHESLLLGVIKFRFWPLDSLRGFSAPEYGE
jgi:signal peptidase I